MAQDIYQWDQSKNMGLTKQTKQNLTSGLDELLELLEPTKDPCVTATINLNNTRVLVNQLPRSKEKDKYDKVQKLLATISEIKQFVDDNITSDSIVASYRILQRIYEIGAGVLENDNEQALMLHLAVVASWRGIVLGPTRNTETSLLGKEEIEKMLEGLRQYFEKNSPVEKTRVQVAQNTVYNIVHSTTKKGSDSCRNSFTEFLLEKIKTIQDEDKNNPKARDYSSITRDCILCTGRFVC